MSVKNNALNNKMSTAVELIKKVLSSRIFLFVTAALILLSYYVGLDIFLVYYLAIAGILILIFFEDLTPLIAIFLFLNLIVSYPNSPSPNTGGSDYFFHPAILAQVIVVLVLFIGAGVFRLIRTIVQKKFKLTPMFFGLCGLSVAFAIGGFFSEGYSALSLAYGLLQAVLYLGLYALMKDNIVIKKDTFKNIAFVFFVYSIVLLVMLAVGLLSYNVFADGEVHRGRLVFGWGVYNTMGMWLLFCVPAAVYLARVCKRGWLFTIYSLVLALACVLSLSRAAMLGIIIIYPLCLVLLFIKSKEKLVNACIVSGAAVIVLIFVAIKWEAVWNAASSIFANLFKNGEFNASGRGGLLEMAGQDFLRAPFLGVGFFGSHIGDLEFMVDNTGLGFIPFFYHNTIMQMLASCGVVGLLAYIVHRVQTVKSFLSNVTAGRSFLAITILSILILSLLDVHMFDIMPTFMYSSLLAVLVKTEKYKEAEPPAEQN